MVVYTKEKDQVHLMGKIVRVTHKMIREFTENRSSWIPEKLSEPRFGWIVGFRPILNGKYHKESTEGGWNSLRWEEPPHFVEEGRFYCVQVVFWPNMRPVPVRFCDCDLVAEGRPEPRRFGWTKEDKQQLRDVMKDSPRDKQGRWISMKKGMKGGLQCRVGQ